MGTSLNRENRESERMGSVRTFLAELSVPARAVACVHAYQLGSDDHTPAFRVLIALAVGGAVYTLGVRVWSLALSKSQRAPSQS